MLCLGSLLPTLLFFAVTGQETQFPDSPCADIFTYKRPESGEFTFENDLSGRYELEVNMTSDTDTDLLLWKTFVNISRGGNITYHVISKDFSPILLASVVFQGKLRCNNSAATGAYKLRMHDVTRARIDEALLLRPSSLNSNSSQKDGQPVSEICGRRRYLEVETHIIVNGTSLKDPAYEGEFPWLVAMFNYDNGAYRFNCGGNLVSRTHVITAAHCFKDQANRDIEFNRTVYALGAYDIERWQTEAMLRGIEKYTIHPDYKRPSDADVAVAKLDKPVDFGDNIVPICLWDEPEDYRLIVGAIGEVGGWGRAQTGSNGHVNKTMKVMIPVVLQDTCLRSDPRYFKLISERTFCAGRKDGKAPCTGDAGNPFMVERGGRWRLRGLVSSGLIVPGSRSCDPYHYVVFSDLAKFKPWIAAQLDGYL